MRKEIERGSTEKTELFAFIFTEKGRLYWILQQINFNKVFGMQAGLEKRTVQGIFM